MTTTLTIQETGTTLTVASTLRMTASEAETLLDGVFEPVLGNPGTNGYVLSSTTAGVRSWVAQSGGGDVDDLTTTTGSSTNMLRVAAAGGLEYRTTAQVLADIGAAPTASPTFTGTVTLPTTVASVIKPTSDSTTALQLANAAGTAVVTVDTTNNRVGIAIAPSASSALNIGGSATISGNCVAQTALYSPRLYSYPSGSSLILGPNAVSSDGAGVVFKGGAGNNTDLLYIAGVSGRVGWLTQSPTAYADLAASTTAAASLRIRSGTAPTTPNAGDIWNDGTDFNLYGSGLKLHTGVIKPANDSTTALQLTNAAGTAVVTVDTTNSRLGIGVTPTQKLQVAGDILLSGGNPTTYFGSSAHTVKQVSGVLIAYSTGQVSLDAPKVYIGGNTTATAYADLAASTTAAASLRIRSGTAPTSPNAGDIWFDGTNLMMYDGTTTRTISWT